MELEVSVNVPKLPALDSIRGARIAMDELARATEYGVQKVAGAIAPHVPVNTGALAQGVQTSVTGDRVNQLGNGLAIVGRVFNPLVHALPMEKGSTKRWFPPIAPLQKWAQRRFSVSEGEARGIAFAVAAAIKRRGLRPRKFFAKGLREVRPDVVERYNLALKRIVKRLGSTSGSGA